MGWFIIWLHVCSTVINVVGWTWLWIADRICDAQVNCAVSGSDARFCVECAGQIERYTVMHLGVERSGFQMGC